MVADIQRAAAHVKRKRPGGAPLVVADLSAKHGGRVDRHRSHRSGRDADLLFYVRTPDGRSVENPGFLHFGADGLAMVSQRKRTFVMIDIERTWLLIEALTSDTRAMVQWLFVARWLEALLIEHAQAIGVDEELQKRAQYLLRQPGDSFNHDDHIHLRIACAPEDMVRGCRGGGYRWPWLPEAPRTLLSDERLVALLVGDISEAPLSEASQ